MAKSRSRLIRRIIYVLVALVVIAFVVSRFLQPKTASQYLTAKVEAGDVAQTVALTGTTEPQTRYSLQFTKSGRVGELKVKVGDVVKSGDILATLENNEVQFQLEAQKAALRVAQANLAKALAKQRPEELKLNELKVNLAELDADNSSVSAQNLLNVNQNNIDSADIGIHTAQTNLDQASQQYNVALQTRTGVEAAQFNLEKTYQAYDQAQQNYEKAVADYQRQSDDLNNAMNKTALGLESAQEQFKIATATPREVDVAPIKAQVDQAWAAVHLAEYQLGQNQLKAPTDGLVTDVALDAGENVNLGQPLITLDSRFLEIKALVSEADVTKIKVGQNVTLDFDAFGAAKEFKGTIIQMNPSETIVQGVVYYEAKIQFDAMNEQVRPGMTANLTIQTSTQNNVLKVPARAVQYDGNQAYVQVLKTVNNKQEVEKRNVEVGSQGDEDVQITSGLQAEEEVVTFTKPN